MIPPDISVAIVPIKANTNAHFYFVINNQRDAALGSLLYLLL
jgi:hypothetical protein